MNVKFGDVCYYNGAVAMLVNEGGHPVVVVLVNTTILPDYDTVHVGNNV